MFKKIKEEKNFGIKKGGLFFSNSVEVLLEHLKVNLFHELSCPFAKNMLIVPSQGMEQWIQLQLASSLHIACGFSTTFLNKGIDILCENIFRAQKKYALPSSLEIYLKIIEEMEKALERDEALWKPVTCYIRKNEKRKLTIAKHLAKLFEKYGIYAGTLAHEWETKPSNWQELLWARIFQKWDYPQKLLLQTDLSSSAGNLNGVHIFAFSHISALHFRFFCRISHHVPVFLYHMLPCQEYWSDLKPDDPTLLGSLGLAGRKMARLFEESDSPIEEAYVVFGGKSQLRTVQRELLLLQKSDELQADDSIIIQSCSTAHHEIETLSKKLIELFAMQQLEPKDVIVAAPQIASYVPYIEAVFSQAQIPYRIDDVPLQRNDSLTKGLFLLLDLEKKRWSAPALFELFEHPLFCTKQGFSDDDLLLIREWVHKCGIRWGVDAQHRDDLLQKGHCAHKIKDGSGTWLQGLGYLIEELALVCPNYRIEFTESELLGTLYSLISRLYADIKLLERERTLIEWVAFLKKLAYDYFGIADMPKEWCAFFDKMMGASCHFADKNYSFSLIYMVLEESLGAQHRSINYNQCQSVRFCSMLPMRLVPAKIICLLGMNHDIFPRKEGTSAFLDLLKQSGQGDYAPSLADFDRYMFLEALLSAREKLIISYVGKDPIDHTELPPSNIVLQLLSYCPHMCITHHASYATDHLHIEKPNFFSIKICENFKLPSGDFAIDTFELARLVRSSLSHYLLFQGLKIYQDESLQPEECFVLPAHHKSAFLRTCLNEGMSQAMKKAENEGLFPIGTLGELAKEQLVRSCSPFQEKKVEKIELRPLQMQITSSLSVTFVGTIEGVSIEGLCVAPLCSFKNAVMAWPHYLLLQKLDPQKKSLFFASSNESKDSFFDDPRPFLEALVYYFFYAKENPVYLPLEWVEPILKKECALFHKTPFYDPILRWQLLGRSEMNYEEWIGYLPLVERLYKEMYDAWFNR